MKLFALGTPVLREDGEDRRLPPKNLAILVFLAASEPRGVHRRDALLALFWPDLDQEHARNALNQAVYQLRCVIDSDAVVSRGKEELGVDPDRLQCDAVEFLARLEEGDRAGALELYQGEFLEGFHLSGSTRFERWVQATRVRLRSLARGAALALADDAEREGEAYDARRWLERARSLVPTDELVAQRLIELLDRQGDRGRAVSVYQDLETRLERELDLAPSPETRALIDEVRTRSRPHDRHLRGRQPQAEDPGEQDDLPGPMTDRMRAPAGARGASGEVPPGPEPSTLRHPGGWKVLLLVIVLGAGAVGSVVASLLGPSGESADDASLVAVYPCRDLSEDSAHAYLSVGMTEEIATALTRIPDLHVLSRASTRRLAASPDSLSRLADSLGVDAVLECSVQRRPDQVRVTARLVDTRTERHLWAESYERNLADVFAIQGDVADSVARSLDLRLRHGEGGGDRARRPAAEAYDLHLRAADLVNRGEREEALRLLRQAVRIDPEFAPAWRKMSVQYGHYALSLGRGQHWADSGIAAGLRARELDPSMGGGGLPFSLIAKGRFSAADSVWRVAREEGTIGIGQLNTWAFFEAVRGRCDRSVRITSEARELDTWANTRWDDALAWMCVGDDRRALHILQAAVNVSRSMNRSPGTVTLVLASFRALLRGDLEAADDRVSQLRQLHPDHFHTEVAVAELAAQHGRWEEARQRYEAIYAEAPEARHALTGISFRARYGATLIRSGDDARGRELLALAEAEGRERIREGSERPGLAVELALVHASRRDEEGAVRWLRRAADLGWPWWRLSARDPMFEWVRQHPGFEAVHARLEDREAEMRRRALAVMEERSSAG